MINLLPHYGHCATHLPCLHKPETLIQHQVIDQQLISLCWFSIYPPMYWTNARLFKIIKYWMPGTITERQAHDDLLKKNKHWSRIAKAPLWCNTMKYNNWTLNINLLKMSSFCFCWGFSIHCTVCGASIHSNGFLIYNLNAAGTRT